MVKPFLRFSPGAEGIVKVGWGPGREDPTGAPRSLAGDGAAERVHANDRGRRLGRDRLTTRVIAVLRRFPKERAKCGAIKAGYTWQKSGF